MWKSKCFCSREAELSLEGLLKGVTSDKSAFPMLPGVCRNYCRKIDHWDSAKK